MSEEAHLFINAEGEYLSGQALADAIKKHGVLRFNGLRAAHPTWRPDLRHADLTVSEAEKPKRGLEAKMLRDPSEWQPGGSNWAQDARFVDFSGADLRGADLRALDLSGANLSGANLGDAQLGGAHLRRTDLSGADFGGADLCGADLFEADLTDARLTRTALKGTNLLGAEVRPEALSEAVLDELTLLPDGIAYGALDSPWTVRINDLRLAATQPIPEAAAEPVAEAEARPSLLARLWNAIKRLFCSGQGT